MTPGPRLAATVTRLQDLIRFRTVNPPGDETPAARYVGDVLAGAGLEPQVLESAPGRGNVVARLRGDGSAGGPLLLLSHLDVVPVEPRRWSQDPFGGAIVDGYLYGRGAVDMKSTLAVQLQVVLDLAEEARAAGRDPARDPVPGLGRDVILAATADEEAGGLAGAGWLVDRHPDLLRADACLTEAGGMTVELAGKRFYPIGLGEKGYARFRLIVHGTGGHASVPRDDSAIVLAARVLERLARPTPRKVNALVAAALDRIAAELPAFRLAVESITAGPESASLAAIDRLCRPPEARVLRALLRDSVSPTIVRAGDKDNVIPGTATILIDCRQLPGTSAEAMRAEVVDQLGPELAARCAIEPDLHGEPLEQPADHPLVPLLAEVLRRHDPGAIPLPMLAPFGTDAKHTARLGIPTYGFSPLRLAPDEPFLERFHGDDERVAIDALAFGLAALDDAVRTYAGAPGRNEGSPGAREVA